MPSRLPDLETPVLEFTGPTMGTSYSVRLVPLPGLDADGLDAAIAACLDRVDALMSTYKPDSDVCRFNRATLDTWFPVAPETALVAQMALDFSRWTGGAFDPTVGGLVNQWGFGPETPVGQDVVDKAEQGGFCVRTDPPALLRKQNFALDLCGIAKGYGVDAVAELLLAQGLEDWIIEIAGEVRANGTRPDGSPWRIGVELPLPGVIRVHKVLGLANRAIASSGVYRHFRMVDAQMHAHIINPARQVPVGRAILSVTVIDASTARADALATALLVMGEDEGPTFARKHGISALFIAFRPEGYVEIATDAIFADPV
jgi:FAD:protein FMN transferase